MKKSRTLGLLIGACALCGSLATASAATISFGGDLEFKSKALHESFEGTASGVTGTVNVDLADLSKATGSFSVPIDGMKTGSDIRDGHMKGADWLDASTQPNLKFDITGVTVDSQKTTEKGVTIAHCTVLGNFTLKGTSAPVTAKVTFKFKGAKAKANVRFRLSLAKYGIKGQEGVLGSKVAKHIRIKGDLAGTIQ